MKFKTHMFYKRLSVGTAALAPHKLYLVPGQLTMLKRAPHLLCSKEPQIAHYTCGYWLNPSYDPTKSSVSIPLVPLRPALGARMGCHHSPC